MLERRFGGATFGGDLFAQGRRRLGRFTRHEARTIGGFDGQLAGDLRRQPQRLARCFQHFDQQEKIRRAAAGDRGHRVHVGFAFDPQGGADCSKNLFSERATRLRHVLARVQSGYAAALQRWPIWHATHDRRTAGPALNVGGENAGGD
jgi:hypothetical protein